MDLKHHYGTAEGPLGFPMQDRQAQALDAILKALPKEPAYAYRKSLITKSPTETGERCDVSWITTEQPDRAGDVVISRGMNQQQYNLNPIVTLEHNYTMPPVGKSLWRKATRDGTTSGIKAKTQYPSKPEAWEGTWPADLAFSLVQAGLLNGKSIGFIPTKIHPPTSQEIETNQWSAKSMGMVIDEWIMVEYACTFLPTQQQALVEAVSKSQIDKDAILAVLNLDPNIFQTKAAETQEVIAFTPFSEIEKSVKRFFQKINPGQLGRILAEDAIHKAKGGV